MKFEEGSVVRHKSAIQKMVVVSYEDGLVVCSWMTSEGKHITEKFEECELDFWR